MMGSIYELFHIYFTSFHSSREDMNSVKTNNKQTNESVLVVVCKSLLKN